MTNHPDGGEAILEALRRLEIDFIFSSPGSEWGPAWEALARQKVEGKAGPVFLDCWHETLAVDMALGYTQMTGRVQAVMLHAGVGLLQGAMGIHAAQLAEMPMVILSGEALTLGEDPGFDPGAQWYRSLSVVGGPQRLVEPIVKWSSQVTSVHTLYESIVRAGEMAERTPRGPVYLNVPIETMLAAWTPPEKPRKVPRRPKLRPATEDIDRVVDLLAAARSPLITTDDAGRNPAAFEALVALAGHHAMPVFEGGASSYGNFPKDNPLHQGGPIGPYAKEADLVLMVASRAPWYPPGNRPPNARLVAVSDNPLKAHVAYQNLGADLYLEGDVAMTLRLLLEGLRAANVDTGAVAERRRRWETEHRRKEAARRGAMAAARQAVPIEPLALVEALRDTMPSDAIYVDETVLHGAMLQQHLAWTRPQSYFRKFGGLGQGFGLGLGMKLAAPERPVVLLVGDGSLLYNPVLQGLGASKVAGLPLLVVVFNNRAYEAMRENHLSYYPDGVAFRNKTYFGVAIDGPDYAELGRPFGFGGVKVEAPGELAEALRNGLAEVRAGRTSIVNVVLAR